MQNLQIMQILIVCAKFAKLHKILLDNDNNNNNNNVSAKFAKLHRILLDKMVQAQNLQNYTKFHWMIYIAVKNIFLMSIKKFF
jgi:hypothetical protein